jgi:hypothetical protein
LKKLNKNLKRIKKLKEKNKNGRETIIELRLLAQEQLKGAENESLLHKKFYNPEI